MNLEEKNAKFCSYINLCSLSLFTMDELVLSLCKIKSSTVPSLQPRTLFIHSFFSSMLHLLFTGSFSTASTCLVLYFILQSTDVPFNYNSTSVFLFHCLECLCLLSSTHTSQAFILRTPQNLLFWMSPISSILINSKVISKSSSDLTLLVFDTDNQSTLYFFHVLYRTDTFMCFCFIS